MHKGLFWILYDFCMLLSLLFHCYLFIFSIYECHNWCEIIIFGVRVTLWLLHLAHYFLLLLKKVYNLDDIWIDLYHCCKTCFLSLGITLSCVIFGLAFRPLKPTTRYTDDDLEPPGTPLLMRYDGHLGTSNIRIQSMLSCAFFFHQFIYLYMIVLIVYLSQKSDLISRYNNANDGEGNGTEWS